MHLPSKFYATLAAVALSACQAETVNEAAATAPTSEAMVKAEPVAAPAVSRSLSQSTFLTGRVVADGIQWRGRGSSQGPKSGLFSVATAINVGGETAICGVQLRRGVGSSRFNSQVANAFNFLINGEPVMRNFAYFARAASIETVETTPAACKSTGIPWKAEFVNAAWAMDYTGASQFSF